jgi:DNA polymerase elongation subunit (family B)
MSARILFLDIETAPNIAYVWALYDQNISTDQIVDTGYILCASWKWHGEKEVHYVKVTGDELSSLQTLHKVMDEADIIVHYNGIKFDIPTLNREFLLQDITPPSPSKHIDLLKVVRRQFRFSSNKLDFVCQQLGLRTKVKHKGMELWTGCMNEDKASWKIMEEYNKRDVVILEDLYNALLPWIPNHPNTTLYTAEKNVCPRCGSDDYQSRGVMHTLTTSYKRYQCNDCSGWFKGELVKGEKVEHRAC